MLETICEVLREAYDRNWITSRDGNASLRYAEQGYMFITPSGVRKQLLQPSMFKRIDAVTGEVLQGDPLQEGLKPSGELPLHFGLQKDLGYHPIRVVLHLHPTYTVAAMLAGYHLDQLVTQFPELGRYTSVAPNVPDVPPISQDLADHCIANLRHVSEGNYQHNIVGIDRHGVVAIDSSPWRAMEHIERLEHICKIVLASGLKPENLT